MTQYVDWKFAKSTGARLVPPGPDVSEDEAAEAVAEIRELAAAAVAPVAATSRLTAPGDAPAPLVVDRPTWIEVNADSMAALLQPALERVASRRGKEPSAAAQAIGSKVTAVEAGGMLAFLSTKVLGQYDIAPDGTPALLLVAPNIVATERELGVTPRDFRLWVCLHEETHRVQFTAVPWLREHLIGQARDLAGELAPDMESLRSRLEQVTAQLPKVLSGEGQGLPDLVITPEQREQMAQDHIVDRVRARVDEQTRRPGEQRWEAPMQNAIRQAVFDQLFRLGRLQPLVDEPGVENIHINGYDDVWISYADGRVEKYGYPIAANDRELEREINMLASRSGEGGRSFTSARPRLHMDLPGGARLAAIAEPVATRPTIVIRIHRLVDVTLDQLVEHGTLTRPAAAFLRAAVIAGVSVVTSGFPGAGKTTLLRALADCIPADEKIVTIEMERELYLHQIKDRHPRVVALEAALDRRGEAGGEDGDMVGRLHVPDRDRRLHPVA